MLSQALFPTINSISRSEIGPKVIMGSAIRVGVGPHPYEVTDAYYFIRCCMLAIEHVFCVVCQTVVRLDGQDQV